MILAVPFLIFMYCSRKGRREDHELEEVLRVREGQKRGRRYQKAAWVRRREDGEEEKIRNEWLDL